MVKLRVRLSLLRSNSITQGGFDWCLRLSKAVSISKAENGLDNNGNFDYLPNEIHSAMMDHNDC